MTVLGSGTLVPDDARRSASHLVEGPGWALLLDCGAGSVHGMSRFGVDPRSVTHVALSHFHVDHMGDLPHLLFSFAHAPPAPRQAPLRILGPSGLRERLDGLGRVFGSSLRDPPYPLLVEELAPPALWADPVRDLRLRCHPTGHTPEAVAWRVEAGRRSVGYTGDTGPDPSVADFLSGVDLLIAECAYPDPPPWNGHLTPVGVAGFAARARPGRILLTHLYPELDRAAVPRQVRDAGWEGGVELAEDGTRVVLE